MGVPLVFLQNGLILIWAESQRVLTLCRDRRCSGGVGVLSGCCRQGEYPFCTRPEGAVMPLTKLAI